MVVALLGSLVAASNPATAATTAVFVEPPPASVAVPVAKAPSTAVVTPVAKNFKGSGVYYPRSGEGIISIVSRACGTSKTWASNAAANGIVVTSNPPWLVLFGEGVKVDCAAPVIAPPPPPQAQPAAQPQQAAPAQSSATWQLPIAGMKCFQPNGSREFGVYGGRNHIHKGIDLGSPVGAYEGTPIHAIHSGVASWGEEPTGAGHYIYLNHGDGTYSAYFHMESRSVPNGAHVNAGDVIGYVGASGNAGAQYHNGVPQYHLHFETHLSQWSNKVDPVKFLADRGLHIQC